MKKILSIFLSALLIVTCLLSIPFTTQATVNVEWNSSSVFNSSTKTEPWLGLDDSVSSTVAVNETEWAKGNLYFNGTSNFHSQPILAYDGVTDTAVTDFKWSFNESGLQTIWRRNDALNVYFFHVSDDSNCEAISSYNYFGGNTVGFANVKNCFAVAYVNQATTDGLAAYAFTVLQPTYADDGTYLGLRPLEYTEADGVITPAASSYLSVTETTGGSGIRQNDLKNISLTLKGNKLTLTYENISGRDAAKGEKTFTLSDEALAAAPSGDFVIHHNRDWVVDTSQSSYETNPPETVLAADKEKSVFVCTYANMTINELTPSTNDAFADTGMLFDSTDETDWLSANTATTGSVRYVEDTNNTYYLYGNLSTANILKHNGVPADIIAGIKNFVWEFDVVFGQSSKGAVDGSLAFLFHVNQDSYTNTTDITKLTNTMGVVINGTSVARQQSSYPGSIRISSTGTGTGLYASDFYTITPTDGTATYNEVISGAIAKEMVADTTYRVRITYNDGAVQVFYYDPENKADTLTTAYYEYTSGQIGNATAGDFAIVSANGWARNTVSNMKIWIGDTACQITDSDLSQYNDYKTHYTFDENVHDLTIDTVDGCTIECDTALSALKINSNQKVTRVDGFDGGNDNLGDFIFKYDWSETHHWTKEIIQFRRNGDDYYTLKIEENGAQNGTNLLYQTVKLTETVNGVETDLAEVRVSKNIFIDTTKHTTMIKAVGNTIEVYLAPMGTVSSTPLISVQDDSHTTGSIRHLHNGKVGYIYGINIYDLTAKAYADELSTSGVSIATDRSGYADAMAYVAENPINDVQLAKIAGLSAITLEHDAVNINGDKNIGDILDLVVLQGKLGTAAEAAKDPVVNGTYDVADSTYIRTNRILK